MALRLARGFNPLRTICQIRCMSSDSQQPGWGSGAGHGGGSGGTVRDAGGAFGKREAAQEEQYFRKLQREQIEALRDSVKDELKYHKEQVKDHEQAQQLELLKEHHADEIKYLKEEIDEHQDAIKRHKKKLENLKKLQHHDD